MRWGVIGTGQIARAMIDTLVDMGVEVAAVASHSPGRAAEFAHSHGVAHAFGSPNDLAASGVVDVAYVASTNDRHLPDAEACIDAGVPVLCEKPLTLSGSEARRLVAAAQSRGVFLMEAMWMVFQPSFIRMRQLVDEGVIGDVTAVEAAFEVALSPDKRRLWDPRLGGGALLDLGVYPLTLAHHLAGPPEHSSAVATLRDGVDGSVVVEGVHSGGVRSRSSASMLRAGRNDATIVGTEGTIRLHPPFHHATQLTVTTSTGTEDIDCSYEGSGYRFEVEEVHRCLEAGLTESAHRPLADTVAVLDWMDEVRTQVGVSYLGSSARTQRNDEEG